ncbi:MAG: hypothetical protein PHE68_05940 [Candidatus Peribacteraceae bacterium]|nr:hypothetical protein [Candidatus Peribacteraceae bacterium]MDD5074683.1 hypothetical protein [Candidatus Peribacteraceae bacterium]
MDRLDQNHRLFTEHFPDDGREVNWVREEARKEMLQSRVDHYVISLNLSVEAAVDAVLYGYEPCDPRAEEPSVPRVPGTLDR